MNSKVKTVLLVLLLLIPTYLAIFTYVHAVRHPVELRSVAKLQITDPAGGVYTYDKSQAQDKEQIAALIAINESAKEISAVPEAIAATAPFTAVYHSYNKVNT